MVDRQRALAGPGGDVAATAAQIVDANRGATMADGRRFTTPALIEPGWQLAVPGSALTPVAPAVVPESHVVEPGDSYWRIAAEHLEAVDGVAPSDGDVLAETHTLIDLNAPRLGHDDPHLLLPGETVVFAAPSTAPVAEAGEMSSTAVSESSLPSPTVTDDAGTGAGGAGAVVDDPAGADGVVDAAVLPAPRGDAADAAVPDDVVAAVSGAGPVVDADDSVVPPAASRTPGGGAVGATEPGSSAAPALVAVDDPADARAGGSASTTVPDPGQVVASATTSGSGSTSPVGVGVGGSVLFAAGALGLLEARRRQRLRAAAIGQRIPDVPAPVASTERELRRVAVPERVARLDVALRGAAADLAAQGARVVAVEATDAGELRVTTDRSAVPGGSGHWTLDADGRTWALASRWSLEDLAETGRRSAAAPCPALAHVGSTERGQLYVDLEAVGLLAVDLPEPMATDVLRCIAASVALSPLAGGVQLVTVGLPGGLPSTSAASIEEAESLDAALEVAAALLGSTRSIARGTSTFALRSQGNGVEAWEPVVVVAAGAIDDGIDAALATAGDGLAVVAVGRVESAEWRLEVADDRIVFAPLGVALTPCGLSVGALADVDELLRSAETPLELRARVVALPTANRSGDGDDLVDVEVDEVEPPWSLLVRLFGQVEVSGPDGVAASFERSKALELVVWLSQHRRHPTRVAARTALWSVDVRDATFANVVSDARRALARAVPPPAGTEWLARTLTEELPLHDAVVTDADLIERRVALARQRPPREAVAILRPGVELLTGMPFAGTSYLWPDVEGITSALSLLGVGAALQLARLSLDLGDVEGVFWATGQGLQVLAGHEELIALRMQAHASAGDLAGVRHEWAAYERALDADPWSAATPSPKLVALRHRLLSTPGSAAGG
ncbi:MAG: bacterial transcriptional activator domain-containing protein [Ilumatobacteraceae bacterium]